MLDVVRESATSTTQKIGSIRTCQEDIAERARAATPGGKDAHFLAVLFEQPYCRINTVPSDATSPVRPPPLGYTHWLTLGSSVT